MIDNNWSALTFDELNIDQLYGLLKLRVDVFVVEQNCPYSDLDGIDKQAIHVFLEHGSEVAAVSRVYQKFASQPNIVAIGRVAVAKTQRQQGLARQLMVQSMKVAEEHFPDLTQIQLSAQSHLKGFYSGLGFIVKGEEYLEDGIPHILMIRDYLVS